MTNERKVHYRPSYAKAWIQCGAVIKRNTINTMMLDQVTCRVCMFAYLASQAPWAREFMDKLRGADTAAKRSGRSLGPVAVPATLSEKVHGKEERLGRTLGTLLNQEGGAQKAVSEFFPVAAPTGRTVEPVMGDGGAPAEPVGVQPGQVAEQAGDRRQVSDKPGWDF